jgi:hypothetical protein
VKPRKRWLRSFSAWFFNASPEWVPPHERGPEHPAGAGAHPGDDADEGPDEGPDDKPDDKPDGKPDDKPKG